MLRPSPGLSNDSSPQPGRPEPMRVSRTASERRQSYGWIGLTGGAIFIYLGWQQRVRWSHIVALCNTSIGQFGQSLSSTVNAGCADAGLHADLWWAMFVIGAILGAGGAWGVFAPQRNEADNGQSVTLSVPQSLATDPPSKVFPSNPPGLAKRFGVSGTDVVMALGPAVEVRALARSSPAARAGVAPGDCIMAIGDRPVRSCEQLETIWGEALRARPGDRICVEVVGVDGSCRHLTIPSPASPGPGPGWGTEKLQWTGTTNHRLAGTFIEISSTAALPELLQLCKQVAADVRPTGMYRGAKARVVLRGEAATVLHFGVGYKTFPLYFDVVGRQQGGRAFLRSRITAFRTRQNMFVGIIPSGPKQLDLYNWYENFMHDLRRAIAERDPAATVRIEEAAAGGKRGDHDDRPTHLLF